MLHCYKTLAVLGQIQTALSTEDIGPLIVTRALSTNQKLEYSSHTTLRGSICNLLKLDRVAPLGRDSPCGNYIQNDKKEL